MTDDHPAALYASVVEILEARFGVPGHPPGHPGHRPFEIRTGLVTGTRRRGAWTIQVSMPTLSEALHAEVTSSMIDLVDMLGPPIDTPGQEMSEALRQEALADLARDDPARAAELIGHAFSDEIATRADRVAGALELGLESGGAPAYDLGHATFDRWVLRRAGTHHGLPREHLADLVSRDIADDWRTFGIGGPSGARSPFRIRFLRRDGRAMVLVLPEIPVSTDVTFDGARLRIARELPDTPLDAAIGHRIGKLVSTGTDLDERRVLGWTRLCPGDIVIRLESDLSHPAPPLARRPHAS